MSKHLFLGKPHPLSGLSETQKLGSMRMQAEFALTLVDVGGTKEKAMVVGLDREGNLLKDVVFSSDEVPTSKGKLKHYDDMAGLIRSVRSKTGPGVKLLPIVCVGSPGRFVNGIIQVGSAANLGVDKHEFDGVNPAEELERRLKLKVFVGNDAVAQMGAGLSILLQKPEFASAIKGKKVAYIGPGTGLGGGFAIVDKQGEVKFITDGHIYDIMIPGYENNNEFKFKVDGRVITARIPEKTLKAEDLLSGRAVRQIACAVDRAAIIAGLPPVFLPLVPGFEDVNPRDLPAILDHNNDKKPVANLAEYMEKNSLEAGNSAGLRARPVAKQIAEFQGLMLAKLIELIHTGNVKKFYRTAEWPPEDRKAVKGTADFIIGGSVLTRGKFGEIALARAREYLDQTPDEEYRLYAMTGFDLGKEAAFGTFRFAPREEVRKAIQKTS